MPEDEKIVEESQEHIEPEDDGVTDAESAFDKAVERRESSKSEDEDEPEKLEDDKEKPGEDEGDKKTTDDDDLPEKDKSWFANIVDSVKDGVKDLATKKGSREKEKTDKDPAKKEPKQTGKFAFTKEDIRNAYDEVDVENLPGPMFIGNSEINLKEMYEDDPEQFASNIIVAKLLTKGLSDEISGLKQELSAMKEKEAKRDEHDAEVKEYNRIWDLIEFGDKDNEGIENAHGIFNSNKFLGWLNEKGKSENPQEKAMYEKIMQTDDVNDIRMVIRRYMHETGKKKADKIDEKANKEKEKFDNLHGDSPSSTKIREINVASENDGRAAFDKAVERREREKRQSR